MIHTLDGGETLERLMRIQNPRQRGREFESFVGSLFKRKHFSVVPNARAASPRQTDLFAHRGAESYLIETKWQKTKANVGDIASLFDRLNSTPPSVVGVFVSSAGFSKTAIDRVREHSGRPVLLVTGEEVRGLDDGRLDLTRLLRRKKRKVS